MDTFEMIADHAFGGFRLEQRGLFRLNPSGKAEPISIGSRALDLLRLLIARHGAVVSKDEIMQAVWPGVAVEVSNISVQVSALRRVLDHDRTEVPYIQTVPGRGYRFIAPLIKYEQPFASPPAKAQRNDFVRAQEIRFCTTRDNIRLAWTVNGDGDTVVKAPNWIGHLELDWRNPSLAPITTSIAERWKLVRFDQRGNGLSDWNVPEISFDRFVDDLECVFDAAQIKRAPIVAVSLGCAIAAAFAARRPDRVSAIVMIGGFPQGRNNRPSKKDRVFAKAMRSLMSVGWDDEYPSLRDLLANMITPGATEDQRRLYASDMRDMLSADNVVRFRAVVDNIEITDILSQVKAPCLVFHCRRDRMQPLEQGRLFAGGLPNARLVVLESDNHIPTANDPVLPVMEQEIVGFLQQHPLSET